MSIFSEGWDDLKRDTGKLVSDGAHVVGSGLNAVGLHGAADAVETEGTRIGYDLGADVPELQLGQTTDPAELVHGDPGALRNAAQKLARFSSAFGETADGLKQIDTGHWEGAAADAFRAKFAPEPAKWSEASDATGKAAGALESFAGTVESAQSQARQAIDLWEEGQKATAAATAAYNQQVAAYNSAAQAYNARLAAGQNPGTRPTQPGSFTDPGESLRQEAQQILDEARASRNTRAASAQATIEAATQLAPAEPSLWSQAVDDLSDTFQAGQVADASFTSGVLEGAADIGKFVRSVDPEDPWNMEHPTEYLTGLSGTLAGLTDAALNPVDLVKAVAGSGWSTDPAEAFGKLVPNIALTLATDGGGAAADVSDMGASVSEDVASQGVDDMTRVGDPVNVATGDVVFAQADVSLPGALPLVLERVHKSSWRGGRWLGDTWASSFDQRLLVTDKRIAGVFADGRVLVWPRDPGSSQALPVAGPEWPLRRQPDGSYTVTDPRNGTTWRYARHPGFPEYPGGQGELPLTRITDRAGHSIAFGYGEAGQPETVTHSGGYRIDVTVTGHRVTGLSLRGIPLVSYEYDENGSLAGVANSSGRPLRFTYDGAGRMTGWTDRGGHEYRYIYDEHGRCVRGESPSGALSGTFSYSGGVTRWTDAGGAVTEYRHHGSFRIKEIVDPLGNETRFEHDARGRVTARTDALGRVTHYGYDARGNLVAVTRPDGAVARAEYDDRCQPVTITAADGAVWRQSYDEHGNRTELAAPDGAVTRYGYDERGDLVAVTRPDGASTAVTCDATGLPVAVTGADGNTSRYERDQFGRIGRIGRITRPDGAITSLTWTVEGRVRSRTLPDGSTETWDWDADGHLLRHVSPAGAVTSYEYGPFDTLTAADWPGGTHTEFGYDRELRLESVTHGGLTWRYSYDSGGRRAAETDFNGATTLFLNDPCGLPIRRVSPTGQETAYEYDALGNVISRTAPGEAVTTFGYDAAGRLLHARNASAEISFTRDLLGRVTGETCDGRTVRTSYDVAGRVAERVAPSGAVSTWCYDAAGLPSAMASGGQELRFGYGPGGREVRRDLPGGLTLTQDWDPVGRLAGQTLTGSGVGREGPVVPGPVVPGQVLQRRSYAYTPDGLLAGVEDLLTGNRSFSLDAAGRVTAVTGTDWTEQYAYDPAGNIAAATWPVPWLEDGPQGRREITGTLITRAGNVRYRHDAAGRVITRTRTRNSRKPETWRYAWDSDNRLTAVTIPDGSTWRYSYDPLGRRVAKEHVAADGQVLEETRFAWSGSVLAEQSSLNGGRTQVTTWDYRPGTFTPLAQMRRTSLREAPQEVIDEQFHSIITDLTGMPTEMVAPDGTVAGHQQHTLWGGTVWGSDGASTPLRFPGQYEDPETGLHYNNQRYYDPVTGAYLSPDPLGLAPGPNPHAYVPNPHVMVDPLGLEPGGAARAAPDFNASSSGIANDLRGLGRPDNELVLSGHGGIHPGDSTAVTVPEGTSITMYSPHGEPIYDWQGNEIETANPPPLETYDPGEKLPDYWLIPPEGLTIRGLPRTVIVDSPTRLSDLLAPNMGRVHWAACRVVLSRLW